MIPSMSSDRVQAYRVFQGEIEKLNQKKLPIDNTKDDHFSCDEYFVMLYLKKRCDELERKGHHYDDASD